jgi:thiol-disulfide isomerase/thioredoxin
MRFRTVCVFGFAAFAAMGVRAQVEVPAAPVAAQAKLAEGAKYEERKQLSAAMDSYKQALKAGGSGCAACFDALARVEMNMEAYKDSADTAGQMAAHAPDAKAKAQAEFREGLALYRLYLAQTAGEGAISKDEKRAIVALKQAEPVLKQGEADDPGDEAMRMLHGRILAALKQDENASVEFAACAAAAGATKEECARALHFSKDVSLARGEPAPAFEIATMDGRKVSLDSLAGKVVLVDFWATWCTYCERDSDYVQSMLDSFDDGRFVLLEVSVDENEALWRNYVKSKRLHGVQTRDEEKNVGALFHVTGYPTYIVIDGDGMVRLRAVGIEGDLKGMVRKLLAASAPAAPETRTVLPKAGAE